MESLRFQWVSTEPKGQVDSMFGNVLHVSIAGRARGHETERHRLTPGAIARVIAEAAWVALVAALFFGWLISGPVSDSVSSRGAECVGFGRGARCLEALREADHGPGRAARDGGCISLGKGGRLCPARSAAPHER